MPACATSLRIAAPVSDQRPRAGRWRYRNRRPFRTARRGANNSRVQNRRGTTPYTARRELDRVRESLARSFGEERSQSLPAALGAVLGRADEHLDEIIVQG